MDCISTQIPYKQTGYFSNLMNDYLDQSEKLKPFFEYSNDWKGFEAALKNRQNYITDRNLLVQHLQQQYSSLSISESTKRNIELLAQPTTFTVTTAHQPNLLTGPLYFFYKIFHAIRIAEEAKQRFSRFNFVPVYYMGNEDADLDELGHFFLQGEKFNWETAQTGAVGAMKVDDSLIKLIYRAAGQINVLPHGERLMKEIQNIFTIGKTIQQATFELVNHLFSDWGLVVMIADSKLMKQQVIPVFAKELFGEGASGYVLNTTERLEQEGYKMQAHPREINLFYLSEGIRNRIIKEGDTWLVNQTDLKFTEEEMKVLLETHPENFSPNVILRGIYQETILPNIAFVGGGGETAYWLQLRALFNTYGVHFPVLVARNSFLLVSGKQSQLLKNMQLEPAQLFIGSEKLLQYLVKREAGEVVSLQSKIEQVIIFYEQIKQQTAAVDKTLLAHVEALKTQTLNKLQELEKKLMRAEKRKFSDQQRQLSRLFVSLFPGAGLQERVENFMTFYGQQGDDWLNTIYRHSTSFDQQFVILTEKE